MNTRYPEQLVEEFFICSECSENLIVDSLIGRSEDCQEGALYCTKCTKEMVECDIQDTEEKNKELKEMLARLNATEK
jgi:superfamily II helicase